MPETKELVVELSYLPVSIIIVGLGEEDFSQMIELDADSNVLLDRNGKAAARDIIQFVQFSDLEELAQCEIFKIMMAEVPDQFVDYMVMNQIIIDPNEESDNEEDFEATIDPATLKNNFVSQTTEIETTERPLNTDDSMVIEGLAGGINVQNIEINSS